MNKLMAKSLNQAWVIISIIQAIFMCFYIMIFGCNPIAIIVCSIIVALATSLVILDCILKKRKHVFWHIVGMLMWIAILIRDISAYN